MTTYGTFEIDSVPAPSDIELEAAFRNRGRYSFCAFAHIAQIYLDRLLFHQYATAEIEDYQPDQALDYSEWLALWTKYCEEAWKRDALIRAQDARDLHDTQQDALV